MVAEALCDVGNSSNVVSALTFQSAYKGEMTKLDDHTQSLRSLRPRAPHSHCHLSLNHLAGSTRHHTNDPIMTSSDDTDEPPTRSSDSDVFSSPLESALAEDTSSPSPQSRPTNAVTIAQDFTTRALDFLSHANNETLGACLVGLAAVTYLVLGRIGLLLIGVILGIVLQAAWDGSSRGGDEGGAEERVKEIRRRRETGLDVVTRALDWRDERGSMMTDEEGSGDGEDKMALRGALNFSGFAKETAEALDSFTDAIIRDYVRYVSSDSVASRLSDKLSLTPPHFEPLRPTRT